MKLPYRTSLWIACSLFSPVAAAEIVVLPGDDLQAIVTSAANGEVITLQSNGAFVGSVNWAGKQLTLRAAPGFTPELVGDPFAPALWLTSTTPSTRATLRGLKLTPGPGSSPSQAMSGAALSGGGSLAFDVEGCNLGGDLALSGTGSAGLECYLSDSHVEGWLSMALTGGVGAAVEVTEGCSIGQVVLSSASGSSASVLLTDATIDAGLSANTNFSALLELTVRRATIDGPVALSRLGETSTTVALLESCSLRGTPTSPALQSQLADLRGVNLTITGSDIGLLTDSDSSLENLAVFGNSVDVHPSVPAGTVRNSLIEDGTFAGQDGNFSGSPLVTADLRLIAGSIGIDAGNSTASGLGVLDLAGAARLQDGDGDGLPRVNVGARESVADCTVASHLALHGSGANPDLLDIVQEAVLGGTFSATVSPGAATLATVLTFGAPASTPFVLPSIVGEVLVPQGPNLPLSVSASLHQIPVPDLPQLCGKALGTQAFRIDLAGGIPLAFAGDGAILTLGGL